MKKMKWNKIIVCIMLMITLISFKIVSEPIVVNIDDEPGLFIPFDEIDQLQIMFYVNFQIFENIKNFTATLEQAKQKLLNTFNQVLAGNTTIEQFQSEFQLFYSVMNYANLDFYSRLNYLSQYVNISSEYFNKVMIEYMNFIEE